MRNFLIVVGLALLIALVIFMVANPALPFFVTAQLLVIMILVPLVIGLIIGFALGWSRGRGSVRVKA
jgi:hypothetical protein